jgi:hypothetical protein
MRFGKCAYGDKCRLYHENRDQQHGSGKTGSSQLTERYYDCQEFLQKGKCKWGSECRLYHVKRDDATTRRHEEPSNTGSSKTETPGVKTDIKQVRSTTSLAVGATQAQIADGTAPVIPTSETPQEQAARELAQHNLAMSQETARLEQFFSDMNNKAERQCAEDQRQKDEAHQHNIATTREQQQAQIKAMEQRMAQTILTAQVQQHAALSTELSNLAAQRANMLHSGTAGGPRNQEQFNELQTQTRSIATRMNVGTSYINTLRATLHIPERHRMVDVDTELREAELRTQAQTTTSTATPERTTENPQNLESQFDAETTPVTITEDAAPITTTTTTTATTATATSTASTTATTDTATTTAATRARAKSL